MGESPARGREIAAAAPNNVLTKSLRLEKSMDLKFILKYLIWQGYVRWSHEPAFGASDHPVCGAKVGFAEIFLMPQPPLLTRRGIKARFPTCSPPSRRGGRITPVIRF